MARKTDAWIFYSLDGLKETDDALGQFSKATARNIGRRALRAGGQLIADRASELAPDDPETGEPDLHRSIFVSSRLKNSRGVKEFAAEMRATGNLDAAVSAMRDARRAGGSDSLLMMFVGPAGLPRRYAHLMEFGSVELDPQPYMIPAWEEEKNNALEIIKDELGKEIHKAAKRAERKLAKLLAATGGT